MSKPSDIANANIDDLIQKLSLEDTISLLSGVGFWKTHAVPKLGIPAIKVSDGPNGIRGNHFFMGTPAKALPSATALGSTWDTELVGNAAAKLLADEAKLRSASVILAPTVNIQRSPLGGRSFESFSEDPHLSGHIAASYIRNVQKNGIGACIKHFTGNDMENDRMAYDSIISPRALREIYLMPFMIAQKYADPWAYMTAYNRVNGTHMSENSILQKILRDEWQSPALVMSDWFGVYSISESINAGLDLEMPGDNKWRNISLVDRAIRSKKVTTRTIKERAKKVVELVQKCAKGAPEVLDGDGIERTRDSEEDVKMMRSLASASIVLLKNEEKLLPLSLNTGSIKRIAVIGPNAKARLVSGGGSASLKASYFITPYDGILNAIKESGQSIDVTYHEGARAALTLPTLEACIVTGDGKPGFTGTWHSHFDNALTVVDQPVKTQYIDETNMFFSDSHPKELTERWSLRLRAFLKPVEKDTEFEFGLTVAGRAKLYVDGKFVVDNWTNQKRGDAFFGTGTIEEKGIFKLKKGATHELFVEFCNVRGSAGDVDDEQITLGGSALRVGGAEVLDETIAIEESLALARDADVAIVVVGLNGDWESEGYDRTTLKLPGKTDELVEKVAAVNKKTVVVTQSGSAIEMPWVNSVSSIVHAWYLGNATGDAIADVLFGKVNPSAKLSLTFPKRLEDTPSYGHFASQNGKVRYAEDLYVGYKHYENIKLAPLFSFGHGLSYTTFEYTNLNISIVKATKDAEEFKVQVLLAVKNTGSLQGSEVVQIYIALPPTPWSHLHPLSQLKGFSKVRDLEVGEQRTVSIDLDKYAVSYWEEGIGKWRAEKGNYEVFVGASVSDIKLRGEFCIGDSFEWNGL